MYKQYDEREQLPGWLGQSKTINARACMPARVPCKRISASTGDFIDFFPHECHPIHAFSLSIVGIP